MSPMIILFAAPEHNILFLYFRNLHNRMFENMLKSNMRFFHICPVGRILNRFSQDMALVDGRLVTIMTYLLQDTPVYVSLYIVIGITLPPAILAAMVACLLFILVRQYFMPSAR